MTQAHILGYPRIGTQRELKFALEAYWNGKGTLDSLLEMGKSLRHQNWQTQIDAGLDYITVGDFAWYDHVLGTSLLLGHLPQRHRKHGVSHDTLFKIARGNTECECGHAQDMTKWFNTNYHYLVPEFSKSDTFEISWQQLFDEVTEAKQLNRKIKVNLLGPVSYLYLGKSIDEGFEQLSLLPQLLETYQQILQRLADLDVEWVQIDEPILALQLPSNWLEAFETAYNALQGHAKLLLTTYFDSIEQSFSTIQKLPIDGIHLDLTTGPSQLETIASSIPSQWVLSLGVINGRNVWRSDLSHWFHTLAPIAKARKQNLWIGSSCSLLHTPVDLESEKKIANPQWFAFAKQKVEEVATLSLALNGDKSAIDWCAQHSKPIHERKHNYGVIDNKVQHRLQLLTAASSERALPFSQRIRAQQQKLNLPLLPTTTIGSFPQTGDIRNVRAQFKRGEVDQLQYQAHLKHQIKACVQKQEQLGLDVLVHGEAERNDMVEYFTEHLNGFQTTEFGWVQSYGSRCVKPAIVVSDISRPHPITVEWSSYAQSLTNKPMKGMLTGPVTILGWTFPREDITREQIAKQIALALQDEVSDLQNAGINIIQIDEPAIREGLPLKRTDYKAYLDWAVEAFKISAASARPETQIHTHMCYSEFNEIIDAVAQLDADVITIETARSQMALLQAFESFDYPNDIGPGVYDIHSPAIPSIHQIEQLITAATQLIPLERLWINPDCGLKTRAWEETQIALHNMVTATKNLRVSLTK
ncbi:5-methyltetrahydropteroyltriglutamate--homocysteine S-methyltransferase [Vibrio gallicus]|uniref:5-methyltetrahydropteroyltriglutamate-- homocysteine S-methyltransferase n=1 Tax=Vibrio gallicus TaxID=190897 RepID=UPI0021C3CF16|nr:5-methyltetrahydropteroyltriglutamate--homocysteine S-methyltransferase [Vibrio gallicus]